jgi:hypothetical protein
LHDLAENIGAEGEYNDNIKGTIGKDHVLQKIIMDMVWVPDIV